MGRTSVRAVARQARQAEGATPDFGRHLLQPTGATAATTYVCFVFYAALCVLVCGVIRVDAWLLFALLLLLLLLLMFVGCSKRTPDTALDKPGLAAAAAALDDDFDAKGITGLQHSFRLQSFCFLLFLNNIYQRCFST